MFFYYSAVCTFELYSPTSALTHSCGKHFHNKDEKEKEIKRERTALRHQRGALLCSNKTGNVCVM
jgi:hypothetical protein